MVQSESKQVRIAVHAPLGVGGVSSLMLDIQSGLDRDKLNFDYIVYHDRKDPQEDRAFALGARKLVADAGKIRIKLFKGIVRFVRKIKVFRDNNIKILHYNGGAAACFVTLLAAKIGGVKYITFHSHNGGISNCGKMISLLSRICKPFLSLVVDDFWACSTKAAEFSFPKHIVKEKKYYIMPNAINVDKFALDSDVRATTRNELCIEGKFVVGHAGRFNHQKNHEFLIDIFKSIKEKEPNSVLVLFGVGELMDDVKDKVHFLNLDNDVIFYGASDKMERMYQAMDVFLMPSRFEGLPVSGVEAQASGLPIVFSDTITKEVAVTDNVKYVSLSSPASEWADVVLSFKDAKRIGKCKELKDAGFDRKDMIEHFQNYYLNVYEKLKNKGAL